jgi:anti-sigma factor RsiW
MDKYGDLLQHERLTAYIDGELSPEEFAAMEAELEAHPELQDLLMELRGVRDVMARIGPVKAPPSLFGSVNDSVDLAAARQARRYSVWNSLGTPIMMVMMAATFLFVMSNVQRDLVNVAEKEREKQAEVAAAQAAREVRLEAARAAPPAARRCPSPSDADTAAAIRSAGLPPNRHNKTQH